MKNMVKLIGNPNRAARRAKVPLLLIAIVAVIGVSIASCGGGGDDGFIPPVLDKARYLTADTLGNVYELVISESSGRYAGQKNDAYRLGIWTNGEEKKISTGKVSSVEKKTGGQEYGLKSGNATPFTVEVSDSWITGITGDIPIDGEETPQAAPASIVARGTIANAEDVVYSSTWGGNTTEARAITDFGYMGNHSPVSSTLSGTSIKIKDGQVSLTLGSAASLVQAIGSPEGTTLTPTDAKMFRQDEPCYDSTGDYCLVCVKTATQSGNSVVLDYSMLAYADKAFTMTGKRTYTKTVSDKESYNGNWTVKETWSNCSGKQGWNYYVAREVWNTSTKTVNVTYSVPADSSRPPAGYSWTVFSIAKAATLHPFNL